MTLEEKRLQYAKEDFDLFMKVDVKEMMALADAIQEAKTVFVGGWGRAGVTGKILSMNLSQIGISTYEVSDIGICQPAAHPGDLFVICSNSGTTRTMVALAERAKELGVDIALISSNADSAIGKLAKVNVVIPKTQMEMDREDSAWWPFYHVDGQVMDFVREIIMERTKQTMKDIMYYHNNLE